MKNRVLLVLAITCVLVSCSRDSVPGEHIRTWAQSNDVLAREHPASYGFQLPDGSWVTVSTARLEESDIGLTYDTGEILRSGFLVYPGGARAKNLEEALALLGRIKTGIGTEPQTGDTVEPGATSDN